MGHEKYTISNQQSAELLIPKLTYILSLYPRVAIVYKVSTVTFLIISLIQTYEISKISDVETIIQYGHFYLVCFCFITVGVLYYIAYIMFLDNKRLFKSMYNTDLSQVSKRGQARIQEEGKSIEMLGIAILACTTFAIGCMNYTWTMEREERMLITIFLKRYISLDSYIARSIHWTIHALIMALCFPSAVIPLYFLGVIFYFKIHVIMLIDYVDMFKSVCKHHTGPMALSPELVQYQIRMTVKKHLKVIKFNNKTVAHNQLFYLIYILTGLMVGLESLYAIFSPSCSTRDGILVFLMYSFTGFSLCSVTQRYTDVSEELTDIIYDLDWYDWTVKCQRTYLILLTNASVPLKVSIFLICDVSNELLKKVCRLTYVVANFFQSIKSAHNLT